MALIQWRYKVSYILNVNTNGVRTRGMNPRELMQELTPSSPDYGKVKVGTDGTIGGEVTLAKDTEATTTTKGLMSAADKIKVDTIDDTITRQGNVFNGNRQLVQTTTDGKLPALDGSNLTGITANTIAAGISFDNTVSGLTATNVQDAVDELEAALNTHISVPTAYHIYNGNLAVENTVITNGFGTVLYTGNGTTQSINTGIDMDTQWGDSADEKYGGLVIAKTRSTSGNWFWFDTLRGATKYISSNLTNAEATEATSLTSFASNGFTLGSYSQTNGNTVTFASVDFQTTHRTSGVTNHGKSYTCHYNPYTGFTIVKYEGSGIAGHEIPHHLGRKLGLIVVKNLNGVDGWVSQYIDNKFMFLNTTAAETANNAVVTAFGEINNTIGASSSVNMASNQYIMYGWANSYFDEDNTLIGNYEIGTYQGTGVAGNKVTTRGKPAWVMIKRVDSAENWGIFDNLRNAYNNELYPNLSNSEAVVNALTAQVDGFINTTAVAGLNAAGGQYLYFVVYDNDGGSGKSKYPKPSDNPALNLNAIVPLADGIDSNGSKTTLKVLNETVTGVTLTAGKNYIYRTDTGYGVSKYAPQYGYIPKRTQAGENFDFFNLNDNKWYSTTGGNELATNGTFDSNTSGWTQGTGVTLSVENGRLKVTTTQNTSVYQNITLITGKTYGIKGTVQCDGNYQAQVMINDETVITNNGDYFYASSSTTPVSFNQTFTAQDSNTKIHLRVTGATTGYFDNISVFEAEPELTASVEPRNYLDAIVHADHSNNVTYVEQLPKTHYFDEVKANEYKGKNATSLSVAFNLSTTPVTIIGDMVGVNSVIRTGTGVADIYLNDDVDGTRLKLNGITNGNEVKVTSIAQNKITVTTSNSSGTATSYTYTSINGVGE